MYPPKLVVNQIFGKNMISTHIMCYEMEQIVNLKFFNFKKKRELTS